MYIQLVEPVLTVVAIPGWCLWFEEEVNTAPHYYRSAWEGWEAAQYKHYEREMPNVSVPVWFEHWGTYGTPPTYGNWGHVVQWVPGRGFLSVIGSGNKPGQQWFSTLEQVEKYFTAKFVGWTQDIATKLIVEGGDMPITVEQENAESIMATGSYPGKDYNYKWVGTTDTDGMINQWLGIAQGPDGLAAQLKKAQENKGNFVATTVYINKDELA